MLLTSKDGEKSGIEREHRKGGQYRRKGITKCHYGSNQPDRGKGVGGTGDSNVHSLSEKTKEKKL